METKESTPFWWVKSTSNLELNGNTLTVPKLDLSSSSQSLVELLEKEHSNLLNSNSNRDENTDVGSIIEEISRVAAQSPLGPYEFPTAGERSVDEIIKEAERIYMESSKSFEQLSQRSKTSQNITEIDSKDSTPTPKSISPLPHDDESDTESYSESFTEESKIESPIKDGKFTLELAPIQNKNYKNPIDIVDNMVKTKNDVSPKEIGSLEEYLTSLAGKQLPKTVEDDLTPLATPPKTIEVEKVETPKSVVQTKEEDERIKILEDDNKQLRENIEEIKAELQRTTIALQQAKEVLSSKSSTPRSSPDTNPVYLKTLEELKDTQERNTALELQLETINKSHSNLKKSYDDLLTNSQKLERRLNELDTTLEKYKDELTNIEQQNKKLLENEKNLTKMLEVEKLQNKSTKLQNEKDAKCIQDLNRQIKEMERIIARKHPDSVSALIVAAKSDASDNNLTARKVLEDRIKQLEAELANRDANSTNVFLDIQDKYTEMKKKYENHIEDLELHVNDLKQQLKRKVDTYDIYTQTSGDSKIIIPQKDTANVACQTDVKVLKVIEKREDSHLVATIRGLQTDLSNKEKALMKSHREIEELKKTLKKLHHDRDGSLKNLYKIESRSVPEKLTSQTVKTPTTDDDGEIKLIKSDRDKMKQQLYRLEEDYHILKAKRLHDLRTLQEAHEREISTYLQSINPLREQLEYLQAQLSTTQNQCAVTKEQLVLVTVERDHLLEKINQMESSRNSVDVDQLQNKLTNLQKRYEEREVRLRLLVHNLTEKPNQKCLQCTERQQKLIGYKNELDQLLETVRALKSA